MSAINLNMETEYDEFGHPVHYVTRTAPGLHLGEYVEVWVEYFKKGEKWDAKVVAMRFEDGHERDFL